MGGGRDRGRPDARAADRRPDHRDRRAGRDDPAGRAPRPRRRGRRAAVGAQVGLYLRRAAHDRVERLVVRLEPEELGRVEVRLDFGRDGRVSALIAADRPETLEALQRDARGLERALQDAGLRPGDHGLSFSLRREGGGGHHHHAGRDDGGGGPPTGPGGRPAPPAEPPAAHAAYRLRLLDINA
ncbi:MAG TPA: flagellar hook-length control protein FliK [Geminicoccaceae bacterium]|nr:flagellar hook-length control protein FliK [Geminicoccaceae bacterium]